MKRIGLLLTVALLAGAENTQEEDAPQAHSRTVVLITKGSVQGYWRMMHAGARKAAGERAVNLKWQGPRNETDFAAQSRFLDEAIASRAHGILLAPIHETALVAGIERAAALSIPVVLLDSPAKTDKPLGLIATDHGKAGELAARRLGDQLGGRGRLLMIRGASDNAATMKREEAFKAALAREYPNLKLVADNYGQGERKKSAEVAEELLRAYSDIDGIYASNEAATFGVLAAVANRGLQERVKVVGSDTARQLVDSLAAGHLDALVVNAPFQMGYKGLHAVVDAMEGRAVNKRDETLVDIAVRGNMNDLSIRELLMPEGR